MNDYGNRGQSGVRRFSAPWYWIGGGVLTLLVFCFFAFTSHVVEPGSVGVYYDTPLTPGHHEGVRDEIVRPGRVITWSTTRVIPVQTTPWTIKVRVDDMMTSNKVPLDFDIAITLQIKDDLSAPSLIRTFGGGPVTAFSRVAMQPINMESMSANNPSGEFMSFLRDQVRIRHMDEFLIAQTGDGKKSDASNAVEKLAVQYMNEFLATRGVRAVVTNVALGRANPPDGVKASMERTAEQVQMKTTEEDRATAQRARKAAEEASAEADKAQQSKLGFTNEQFLEKLRIDAMVKVCGSASKDLKDNKPGHGNCTIVIGGAVPTFSLK